MVCCVAPRAAAAQALSAADRDAIVKQHISRGGQGGELPAVLALVDGAAAKGLPTAPLANKIREGIAKGVDVPRIDQAVRQMVSNLDSADRLLREGALVPPANRGGAVTLLADALSGGVTAEAVPRNRPAGARRVVVRRPGGERGEGLGVHQQREAARGRRHRRRRRGGSAGISAAGSRRSRPRGQAPRARLSNGPCDVARAARRDRAGRSARPPVSGHADGAGSAARSDAARNRHHARAPRSAGSVERPATPARPETPERPTTR